jgi:hypothetical protein
VADERDRDVDQSKLYLVWIELAERQLKEGGMNDTFRKTVLKIRDAGDDIGMVAGSNPAENDQQNKCLNELRSQLLNWKLEVES